MTFRPILPEDKGLIEGEVRRLSPESRYLRFHHAVSGLTPTELSYLTEVDYHDHFAWVALTIEGDETTLVGVARYIRVSPGSAEAEAAVAVIDDYQGRGIGTILLSLLAESARRHGVGVFVAYVQPVNAAVIALARSVGGSYGHEDGLLRLDVPLGDSNAAIETVLRHAAAAPSS